MRQRKALQKMAFFKNMGWGMGEGSGIPKLYVKFWWPLFLASKTRLIDTVLGIIPKKYQFLLTNHNR